MGSKLQKILVITWVMETYRMSNKYGTRIFIILHDHRSFQITLALTLAMMLLL